MDGTSAARYLGIKFVMGEPMTAQVAGDVLNRTIDISNAVSDGEGSTHGYLVEYPDGYRSWSPKKQFDDANHLCSAMPFGHAIEAAKQGKKIARAGWNEEFIYLVEGAFVPVKELRGACADAVKLVTEITGGASSHQEIGAHLDMASSDGTIIVGWLASQTDILADDWMIVE